MLDARAGDLQGCGRPRHRPIADRPGWARAEDVVGDQEAGHRPTPVPRFARQSGEVTASLILLVAAETTAVAVGLALILATKTLVRLTLVGLLTETLVRLTLVGLLTETLVRLTLVRLTLVRLTLVGLLTPEAAVSAGLALTRIAEALFRLALVGLLTACETLFLLPLVLAPAITLV